jgi:large subunit ribosomal protein L15
MTIDLSNLHPAENSRKKSRRVGRGPGSGRQKTSGRGHKGQKSNAGFSHKRGFEGGQMPLVRRVPKRGFTNIFRVEYAPINLARLEKISKKVITLEEMVKAGLIKNESQLVKILGYGEITEAKTVHGHRFSEAAQKKIEDAGGKAIKIGSK